MTEGANDHTRAMRPPGRRDGSKEQAIAGRKASERETPGADMQRKPFAVRVRTRSRPGARRTPVRERFARWMLYLFVLSIPFESVETGWALLGNWTPARLIGYALMGSALLIPSRCFRRPPAPFWLFASYLLVVVFWLPFLAEGYMLLVAPRVLQLTQMLVMFWISFNLMHKPAVARNVVVCVAASMVLLAALQYANITTTVIQNRATALGETANTAGNLLGLGLVALVGLTFSREKSSWLLPFLTLPLVLLIASQVVGTGSRGALVATSVGILALLLRKGSLANRARLLLVLAALVAALLWFVLQNETTLKRWRNTVEISDYGARDQIAMVALTMIGERPVFGWGPERHYVELGRRMYVEKMEEHNLLLYVFNEVGVVGGGAYAVALLLCFAAAWRARRGDAGSLPLAFICMLLTISLVDVFHNRKLQWLLLAYICASDRNRPAVSRSLSDADHPR
jgi:O-antigen ligase